MPTFHAILRALLVICCSGMFGGHGRAEENGAIRCALATPELQARPVGGAVVVLCDARTGRPYLKSTRQPLKAADFKGIDDLWHAVGPAHLDDVPPGEYRLIAQSWAGTSGMQRLKPYHEQSSITLVYGVAERVVVQAGQTTETFVTAPGDGQLTVELEPDAEGSYIFISTAPMQCEPVLGFVGWGQEFLKNIIAAAHHIPAQSTFIGLPTDRDLYVGVYCYDNLPGFGGATARAWVGAKVKVPLYGPWSDGKVDPPPKLFPLTEYLETSGKSWVEVAQLGPAEAFYDERGRLKRGLVEPTVQASLEKRVAVGDLGEFAVKDIYAAESYRELREYRRQRAEQQAKSRAERAARKGANKDRGGEAAKADQVRRSSE